MTTFVFPSMTYILYIAGMLERGEIDVALADLSLTFPRAQVKKKKKYKYYFSHIFSETHFCLREKCFKTMSFLVIKVWNRSIVHIFDIRT